MWKYAIPFVLMAGCALAAQPADPLAEGIALLRSGDFQQSLPLLRRAVELHPDSAPAHNYYGFVLARIGSVEQAAKEFRKSLELDPRYPDAYYNLGAALDIQEKYAAAIQNLNAALALKPNFPEAQFELGNALAGQDDINGAMEALEKAIRLRLTYAPVDLDRTEYDSILVVTTIWTTPQRRTCRGVDAFWRRGSCA